MISLRIQSFNQLNRLSNLISRTERIMYPLEVLQNSGLPESWIGAGLIRNCVWDVLHQTESSLINQDVDVIFYNEHDLGIETEKIYEEQLISLAPQYKWSVKNQARMKLVHQKLYNNCWEAVAHWPETSTSVAARIGEKGVIETLTPYGTNDLFDLILRPTPYIDREIFINRVLTKKWLVHWPKLRMIL